MSFEVRQELDAVHAPTLARVAIAFVLVAAIAVFLGGAVVFAVHGRLRPDVIGRAGRRPAVREISHVEQTDIWKTRVGEDLRESQRRDLEGWGWADRKGGLAKIPVDRAMDIVVARGAK
jgi:hypothetical protein